MAYEGRMKYFALTSERMNPFPQITGGRNSIDARKLNREHYNQLPRFIQLQAEMGRGGVFPDIILKPFLLLSRIAMEVTALYDPAMPFRFTVLFDTEKGECVSYYCPVMEEQDCLVRQPEPGSRKIILNRKRMTGLPLFKVRAGMKSEVLMRMDLAESLLEREAVGLELREVCLSDSL